MIQHAYTLLLGLNAWSVVSSWSWYGEWLEKQNTASGWDAANSACRGNYSMIASPLDPIVREAVVRLVLDNSPITAPEVIYWTGFTRNPDASNEWIGDHFTASDISIKWRSGYSGDNTGDCLAMEVMPFGISYFPEDCTTTLQFICHKFQNTFQTQQSSVWLVQPPVPHSVFIDVSWFDCNRACFLDRACTGYDFSSGTCTIYNEFSFTGGPPTTTTTTTTTTTVLPTTTICPMECFITDCQCNDTSCDLSICALPGQAPNCTFTDCTNSSVCEPFTGSICAMNDSNVFIQCSECTTTTVQLTTPEMTTTPELMTTAVPVAVNYPYREIIGCVDLYNPDYGMVYSGNTTFNSTRDMKCFKEYVSATTVNNKTLYCDVDRRWNFAPFCMDEAPGCPLNWYEYKGSCYQVQDTPVSWFDQSCDLYNAFSLHIQSPTETNFVTKLLYYHSADNYWTGGTNINVRKPGYFYWNYNHDEMKYKNFEKDVTAFPESSCVSIFYTNNSYYYQAGDCMQLKPYVCKKGRVLIGGTKCHDDLWCIGGSTCLWSGSCSCVGTTLYGQATEDPTAYCGNAKLVVSDSILIMLSAKGWEYAIAECENAGGSLLTTLSKDWEEILQNNYGISGDDIRFWSGYRFDNGTFYQHGASSYIISDLTQIPWVNIIQTNWMSQDLCVSIRVSALGVRYVVSSCLVWNGWMKYQSLCQLVDNTVYYQNNKKYTTETPLVQHYPILTDSACYLKCQYNNQCLSFNYFSDTKVCKLYGVKSASATLDEPNSHQYRSGCRRPYSPVNGYLVGPVLEPADIGHVLTYECDDGYRVPDLYSSTLTCLPSGQWNNVPKCVVDGLSCPQGWEQMSASCYNVQEDRKSYDNAVTYCKNIGGSLVEVYSLDEMEYLAVLLDHNRTGSYYIGANCKIMDGFYSWSTNPYAMVSFYRWYNAPIMGSLDCVVLSRMFRTGGGNTSYYLDTGTVYYASADCGDYTTYNYRPFVCKKNLLNVGAYNCSQYGADPCKQNSQCLDNKCVCRDWFYQLGVDDDATTECLPIQPVGNGPCYNMDEFCLNNATCVNDVCVCINGSYQNGQSGSISTLCQEEFVSCPADWFQHDRHCYSLVSGFLASEDENRDSDPAIHCGMHKAYMAVIPDMETNEVIAKLGNDNVVYVPNIINIRSSGGLFNIDLEYRPACWTSRSYRLIGLVDEFNTDSYEWLATETPMTMAHFEFTNTTKIIGAIMNPLGYWIKTNYVVEKTVPLGSEPKPKNTMVCEKPHLCLPIPVVDFAMAPPAAEIGEHVGTEYIYTCNTGYIISNLGYSYIKCRETGYRVSKWDPIPQCVSLLTEKYIQVSGVAVDGTFLQTYTGVATNQICASYCYDLKPCEAFNYFPGTGQCDLYDLQTTQTKLVSNNAEIWKTNICDPIPYVEHATMIQATGRSIGDTVTYRCAANYRIARNTSTVLTCLSTGRWDSDPPLCIKRFSRKPGAKYKIGTFKKNKMYFNIFSVDDCEVKCIEETRFRCMFSMYRSGTCHLYKKLPSWYRVSHDYLEHTDGAFESTFEDTDIAMFERTAELMVVDGIAETYSNVSYEICAQNCAYDLTNCTMFEYWRTTGYCRTFSVNPASLTTAVHIEYDVFTRIHMCSNPPDIPGITLIPMIRQSQLVHYIGDVYMAKCNVFGEEVIADHSGEIECLATGYWSPRIPACKNLCEPGWYMFNYTCYKLETTQMTFWDAFSYCHSLDAGLVNVYTVQEYQYLLDIWNFTSSPITDLWVGLYSDLNLWQWTESLGGNVGVVEPALSGLAMVLSMPGLSMTSKDSNIIHSFACEKAAPKLRCPDGWAQYKNKCYQAQATTATYQQAATGCNALDAKLATVSNFKESDILGQLANETGGALSYVGLERPAKGHYKWNDGSIPRFRYLITEEEEGGFVYTSAQCGVVLMDDVYNVKLKNTLAACTTARPYICQKFIDHHGVADDYTNLPCSTDNFCGRPDLACLGGVANNKFFPPRCSGKECPPPWSMVNNKCMYVANVSIDYFVAAHNCWNRKANLARMESFIEVYNLDDILPKEINFHIGFFVYETETLIDIKTKKLAKFPSYYLGNYGSAALAHFEKGVFIQGLGSCGFICEKNPVTIPSNSLQYEGCFGESTVVNDMDLPYDILVDNAAMTIEMCIGHCSMKGYLFAGIMSGSNCGCGNSRGNYMHQLETTSCRTPCTGNGNQYCGGAEARSVYRTTEKKCSDRMPRNPLDPRVCYTSNSGLRPYNYAKYDCLHQGGYSIMPKTPIHEKNIYNQMLLGSLKYEERLINTTNPTVWFGIGGPNYDCQDDQKMVEYMNWDNKDYPSFWKWGVQTDLNDNGGWRVDFGGVTARTGCEIYDYDSTYSDPSIRTEYRGSYHPGLHTKYGEVNISSSFDLGCFYFPERCPNGFSVMFWYYINQTNINAEIFTTGTCSFRQIIISPGLCVFYSAPNHTVSVAYSTRYEVSRLEFPAATKVWTHLLVHFDRNESVIVYVDGQFHGTLLTDSNFQSITKIIHDDVDFHSDAVSVSRRNFSFIAAAPDQALLQHIQAHPYQQLHNETMIWTSFQSWSIDSNVWASPGVDGNGLQFPYKSFVYQFDHFLMNATCLQTQECWLNGKTFAMWIKISSSLKESVDIFSFGSNLTDSAGLRVHYKASIQKLNINFNDKNEYAAEFNMTLNAWTHVAMVINRPTSVLLYVNGSLFTEVASVGLTPGIVDSTAPRYLGTVMCPLGWTKYGSSCYQFLNMSSRFWDLQHTCEEYGGNLVSVDDETELKFIKQYLYGTYATVYLGVYDVKMDEYGHTWVNSEGRRQSYRFWEKIAESPPYNKSYMAITCDPACGLVNRKIYIEDANFTGYSGLCEISQKSMTFRREDRVRCPSGWIFWEYNCYLFTNATTYTGLTAVTHCASQKAVVVEIDSPEEQRFIANALKSLVPLPKKAHIGPKFRTVLDNGVAEFTHGDFKPLQYNNWGLPPANTYNPVGCAMIDCGLPSCSWVDIACTQTWPAICEKPARKYCSHGWDEFGDTCTSIHDTTLTPLQCLESSSLVKFKTVAEVLEFASMYNLVGLTCLTDGIVTSAGYVWDSTGEPTYFTSETLTGTGNCVGITSTGLVKVSCTVYPCAVCQHGQSGGVSVDNVYFKDGVMDSNSIMDMFNKEKPTIETYRFTMSSYVPSSNTMQGVKSDGTILYLTSTGNITTHTDPVLGPVLSVGYDSTTLVYNVTDSDSCLQSFDHCEQSFGTSFWMYPVNVTECMVIDTVTDGTTGVRIGLTDINGTALSIEIKELNYITQTSVPVMLEKEWTHINVVWQKYVGLKVFVNFNLIKTVPPTQRSATFPATPVAVNSSHVLIGNCSLELNSSLLIRDLDFGINLLEEDENKQTEDILRVIDFNEPKEKSMTNVHVIVEDSMVETYWRNSLFLTAAKINNPTGLTPALRVPEQTFMCFTNNDVCRDAFTLSLWLYPRNILQSQTFLYTGTRSHSVGIIDSTKLWYDTTVDKYYLSIEYDRTKVLFEFYIYLFEWSHLVLSADFVTAKFDMYLNGVKDAIKTVSFLQSRVKPVYPLSFMEIGVQGTFDIDDLKFLPYVSDPSKMYVLKSCAEFMLAGITGVKNQTIDFDTLDAFDNTTVQLCNLDLGIIQSFYFSMELNETNPVTNTIGLNASINFIGESNVTNLPVIHGNGILLNHTAFNITGVEDVKCFYDVRYCYFGFTFAAWIKIIDVSPISGLITLFEMGGNTQQNENGVSIACTNMTDPTIVNCSAIFVNGTDRWTLHFTILKKQLFHLSLTWNPHLTLIIALNGHSTEEFGRYPVYTKIPEAGIPLESRPITVGVSAFDQVPTNSTPFESITTISTSNSDGSANPEVPTSGTGTGTGILIIDELTIVDNYLEDIEIKKLFGTLHECEEKWTFIPESDRCYHVPPITASYTGGATECQNLGGFLARLPDMVTRTALSDYLWSELLTNAGAYVDLTQLPRGNILFPIRQPSARVPVFPDMAAIAFVSTNPMPRCVHIRGDRTWVDVPCSKVSPFICEKEPMYVKESPFYINETNMNDEEFEIHGEIKQHRGLARDNLLFNNSFISFVHADDCLSNFDYCHNGLSLRFWLMTQDNLYVGENQVIFTNMMSQNSSGLRVSITRDATHHLLSIEIRNRASFTIQTVSVSSFAWTHVVVSVTSDSQINIYLNAELSTPVTLLVDPNDVMIRELGVSADITYGAGWNGSNQALCMVHNLTYKESSALILLPLKMEVYSVFPRFTLPFDDVRVRSPFPAASTSVMESGYIGNAIFSDSVDPTAVNFIGQFAYDCFGSQNTCLEGFTMLFWIMAPSYINAYSILNNMNQNTGILIDFRTSDFSLANKFWLTLRDGTTIEKHYPFNLVPGTWSQVGVTWCINGTTFFNLNGGRITAVYSHTVTPVTDPVTKLQFDDTLVSTGLPLGTKGGIDELLVIRSPVNEVDLLNFYKNSTFMHKKFVYTFDNVTSEGMLTIEGVQNQSVRVISGVNKINLTSELGTDICFSNINLCVHGFTMKFAFRLVQELDLDQTIMTTGGDNPDGLGFALTYTAMNKTLPFRRYFQVDVRTSFHEYVTWFNMQYGLWTDIMITFHPIFGIRVFVDDVFVVCDGAFMQTRVSAPLVTEQELTFGSFSADLSVLGIFDIDHMTIIDVAVHDENIIQTGVNVIKHIVHTSPEADILDEYTEVTRDECHQYCMESQCDSYTHCDHEYFGSCFAYTNMTNTTLLDGSCDLFMPVYIESIPVQDAGCLYNVAVAYAAPLSINESCAVYCKNISYHYFYEIGTTCHCLHHNETMMDILDAENLTISQTCIGQPILQATGWREFIQPLSILYLTVTSTAKDMFVIKNESMMLNFEVNNGTYAGYRIDAGDGRPVYYTKYSFTSLTFSAYGTYIVEITAMNEVSAVLVQINVTVFARIEDVLINHTAVVATDSDELYVLTVIEGSQITCDIDYGDGVNDTMDKFNASFLFEFTHAYTYEQEAVINVTCFNPLSFVSNVSTVIAIDPIVNLTMDTPYSVVYGENITANLSMVKGSNISLIVELNGVTILTPFFWQPNQTMSFDITLEQYNWTGTMEINVTATNPVSGPYNLSNIVFVDVVKTHVTLDYNIYSRVNESVMFDLSVGNGSNVNIFVNYGDGTLNETYYIDDDFGHKNLNQTFYHIFSQPGVYFITCQLDNSVSNITLVEIIYVETPVDYVLPTATSVEDPYDLVNLTFTVPQLSQVPSNAFINISFGNGDSLDGVLTSFNGTMYTISYNYTMNGIYTIDILMWNNVSAINFTEVLVVGRPITNLTAVSNTYFAAVDEFITLSMDMLLGSQVAYMIDFEDGTSNSTDFIYTTPNAAFNIIKSFSQVGIYNVFVTANNSFGSVTTNMTIYVQEKVQGVVVLKRHVGKMNYPFKFTIEMNAAGTNSCFLFEVDNITLVVGDYHCMDKPEFQGMNYTYGTGNPLVFYMEFSIPRTYNLKVNASNEVSSETFYSKFIILEFPCSYPEVMIYGLSQNIAKPTEVFASDNLIIRAISDTYCDPLQTVLFDWSMAPKDPGMAPVSLPATTLPYLMLPDNTLDYGTYQINVTVLIKNYEIFNDTAIVYIRITRTPLVALVKGDDIRTVRSETALKLDASWSYDPDFPLTGVVYNLTWYCWNRTNSLPFNMSTAILIGMGTNSCFPTLNPANINYTVVTIPSSLINDSVYHFVAVMTSGERESAKAQEVRILTPDVDELILQCVQNCIDLISPTDVVRFKGLCETCTSNTRLQVPYKWRLFYSNGTEILDFSTWTDTGVEGANLMIKPGYLGEGQDYMLRLESGPAFTAKFIHVVYPPYSGTCSSQINVGKAFESKFIFTCDNWQDEFDRKTRDLAIDSLYQYAYTFTFSYQVIDAVEHPKIPLFQVWSPMGKTPGLILPPGKVDFNYMLRIIIDIVDKHGAKTIVKFEVQVKPFDEVSGTAVLEGWETDVCLRERDMACLLTFGDGLASFNSSHPDDAQFKDDLTSMLFDNKDLIQDPLQVTQTSAVLAQLADNSEDLSAESQDKMRNMMSGLVSAAETSLSNFMSQEEKENMAASILRAVTTFCQKTKYDPTCDANCDDKLVKGNYAVEFIDIVHNLTGLLLLGNVAGESSTVISVPVGNVKYQAQRKESLDLVNMTMNFVGAKTIRTRSIPEFILQMETVDIEMMQSDNLYTVDESVNSVKSRVTVFELLKLKGERIKVEGLPAEIDIHHYPEGLQDLNYTYVNLSATTDLPMFYVEIRLNETNVIPVIVLRPDDIYANITYYVRKNYLPSRTVYDISGSLQENAVYDSNSSSYIIEMDISGLWTGFDVLPTNVYIGLEADYNISETSPMVDVALYVLGCYYWKEPDRTWSQSGLTLGPVINLTSAVCKTSHLSAFGMNMFVPPNTIDFSTVFSKFSADNLAVLITIGVVLLAYFILLIPIIRADRRDFKKWAIYPLADNVRSDVYHYQVSVYTGVGKNSGTTSKVYFVLGGEDGDTEVRLLQDEEKRPMLRGSVNNYLLSVPESLGNLMFLRMWIDESDKIDDWLLNMVLIRDVQTDEKYAFLFNKWFSLDKDAGQIDHLIPVATPDEMSAFGHLFFSKTRKDLTDGHLWFSVVSRPQHSTFTRAQRLSCCLSLLFMTMITNCMWYKTDSNKNDGDISQNVHLGPFTFSSQEFFTSLFGTLIVIPLNLLIVTLFRKSKPHTHASSVKVNSIESKGREQRNSIIDLFNREVDCATPSGIDPRLSPSPYSKNDNRRESVTSFSVPQKSNKPSKKQKSAYPLPHWCLYVAWILVALSVLAAGFFTVLYSMEWGSSKSSRWLTSFILSFVESVLLVQPLKVIMLAIIIALVFKTVDEDDSVEEVFVIGREKMGTQYPEHRQRFVSDSIDLTRITEAKEHRLKMNRLFETMRKIMIYVVYLSVVAVLAYENKDVNSYPTYRNLHNILIQPATKSHKNFANLQSTKEFYSWMENTVLPGLYSNGWYNDSIDDLKPYISDNTFYRLGSPRLRQARINNEGCKTPPQIREFIDVCYQLYETKTYENRDFTEGWNQLVVNGTVDEWAYQDTFDLDGLPTVGRYASYSGGGYVAKLGATIEEASAALDYLRNTSWVDRKTRGVFIEFNLFNPNVNLFCSVILLLEFPPTGSVFPYWEVRPLVLYKYVGPSAIFLFVFDVIFAAYTLYYLIAFIKQYREKGCRGYFTGFWSVVDFVNILLSVVCCAFYGVYFVITKLLLKKFHENREEFINLQRSVLWDELFGVMLGFILFLSMLKTLQLVRFNAKIAQLYGTITKSTKPLLNYMVVFLISFSAFVSCGYLLFGRHDYEYSSFLRTTETLMSMLMMKVNIDTVLVVSGLLGSLYIFCFVLFVVFVLLNILLSIINEAFADSRKDPSCQSDDPEMVDFLLGQLKRFIWGADRNEQRKLPEDVFFKMDKLERKMDRYFIQVINDERNNVY